MIEKSCAAAQRLLLQKPIDGLSEEERRQLESHLDTCESCSRTAMETAEAIHSLRAVSVAVPAALAERTQLRVYLRRQELRNKQQTAWAIWLACGVSWMLGLASAPYIWRVFRWFGTSAGVPDAIWKAGFALWWAAPALLAVTVLLIERSRERYDNVQL